MGESGLILCAVQYNVLRILYTYVCNKYILLYYYYIILSLYNIDLGTDLESKIIGSSRVIDYVVSNKS